MRLPRPRLTVRRLMLMVVVVATLLFLGKIVVRRKESRQQAVACLARARFFAARAQWVRKVAQSDPNQVTLSEDFARRCDRTAAYYRRWAGIWREAAEHPWRARPRPEPLPR